MVEYQVIVKNFSLKKPVTAEMLLLNCVINSFKRNEMFLEPVGYLSANRFFFRWLFFTYTEYSEFEIGRSDVKILPRNSDFFCLIALD